MALNTLRKTFLYTMKAETRWQSLASFKLTGNTDTDWMIQACASLYMSTNGPRASQTLVWTSQAKFIVGKLTENPQILRIDAVGINIYTHICICMNTYVCIRERERLLS